MKSEKPYKYIYKQNDCFIIKKAINGKLLRFGKYSTLEKAIIARDEIIKSNWEYDKNKYETSPFKEYKTRYIYKNKYGYQIVKNIDGLNKTFGNYKTLKEAITARDELIKSNWKYEKKEKKSNKYIQKRGKHYYIYKKVKGHYAYFGTFKTLEEAITERDELISRNWKKKKYNSKILNETLRYIIKTKTGSYAIKKVINGKFIHFNTFKTLDLALSERDLLEYYKWDYELLIYCEGTYNNLMDNKKVDIWITNDIDF